VTIDTPDASAVAAAYDRWAESYDTDPNQTRALAAAVLRQGALELVGHDVIEIGCGTGHNTQWLAGHASSVLALDISEGMLRQAKARVPSPRVRFVRHDVRSRWPLADASADLVVAMLVLEHVEHQEEVHFMAVRPERHRRGIGRTLLHHLELEARAQGGRWLHVKTLAPSHPDPYYARTRAFYQAMGFTPLFESTALWGPENPTVVLVKPL
jgi:2-polyprenyl-3-methyl-5-hydroxy-6-metoxy-1,4-benzoquinol methylase